MRSSYQLTSPVTLLAALCVLLTAREALSDPRREVETCGSFNPNYNVIDLREPTTPDPFHDLTRSEILQIRAFMERDPNIRASPAESAAVNTTYIHTADLLLPPKADLLKYLDTPGAPRPERRARVLVSRGDQEPPVMEEYVCSPLPEVRECKLLHLPSRKNPVAYAFGPISGPEVDTIQKQILPDLDRRVSHILLESYGAKFTGCDKTTDCLAFQFNPVGSGLVQESKRLTWFIATYNLPYNSIHFLDFAFLLDSTIADPSQWSVVKLWYSNALFDSYESLIEGYKDGRINKTRITKPVNDENLFSSLKRRGGYEPEQPQRPPTLVEPDGPRYSVTGKEVTYLGWRFNFRLSDFTGPAIYDVRYQGQRIAYEVSLSEIAVFYSGHGAYGQTNNYVDSSMRLGSLSRSLVPGGDCPDTATLISSTFLTHDKREPDVNEASFCLFEHNNGYPLRRHMAYKKYEGSFYGGMLDYVLILRSALTIGNYDYVVDFIFHQNAVVEVRFMSTGYIQTLFYTSSERPYGFQIHDHILGNVHFHAAHFKVDVDVDGTSNRYQTLDVVEETVNMTAFPDKLYSQTRFTSHVKKTELEAIYDFNFNTPKYHVVHNDAQKTDKGELKAYRIQMNCGAKNLVKPDFGNEKTVSWARHQMVVTKHKDDEISSSSMFGMYDSLQPTVNFTAFYGDNDNIVDQDLVFWISCGMHHIPHTEDLPVTPTVGNHLTFFLLPYNYFPECPSMGSRDAIYVEHIDPYNTTLGVKVERNGNNRGQCVIPKPTLEEDLAENPNRILES